MPLPRTVSQILNLGPSFSHDDILTSIPSGQVNVAKIHHPIDAFTEILDEFELSIEIRDRLTRTEVKYFDPTLAAKLHAMKSMSLEGPHYSQLKALKRLTKARVHLKKTFPGLLEDVNKIIWSLLAALGGVTGTFIAQPAPRPVTATTAVPSIVQFPDKMLLSSITTEKTLIKRSSGHQIYLRFNDTDGAFEIKGVSAMKDSQLCNMRIICADVKSLGELSGTEVGVGMKDGKDYVLELRDEKDAELLVKKIEQVSGVAAYTARY